MQKSFLLAAALAMLTGCGGGDSGGKGGPTSPPVDNTPAAIALSQTSALTLASGATTTITATVTAKDGRSVSTPVTWSSADAAVASVNAGVITAAKVGTTTISATAGTLVSTVGVTVTPGAAAALALRTQPVGATIGSALKTQPVVEIRDAAGNIVTGSVAPVTASIATGGGTLGGTVVVAAASGVATFSDLSISGAAGDRTLTFAAPGLASVTSAAVTMTPPPTPIIVVDSSTVNLVAVVGSSPSTRTINVTNGGTLPLVNVTLEAPTYSIGTAGWLTATLSSGTEPYRITLNAAASALPVGSYRASFRIVAPGAPNSPFTVTVNLSVVSAQSVTYGATSDKSRIVDVGESFVPTSVFTEGGVPKTASAVTFTSRAPSIATVDAAGRITGVASGATWVVAQFQTAFDSAYVTVTRSTGGPVLRPDFTAVSTQSGDTLTVNFVLDSRGVTTAGASVLVGYERQNGMFTLLSAVIPTQTAQPVGSNSSEGVFRVSVASATGLPSTVTMLQLKLIARTRGLAGWLTFSTVDIVGVDGTDLSSRTTSTRVPVIIK